MFVASLGACVSRCFADNCLAINYSDGNSRESGLHWWKFF